MPPINSIYSVQDGGDQTPTTNPRWPGFDPFLQRKIEHKFFEEDATIHFERLPPLQFWTPLFHGARRRYIISKVIAASAAAQRRLTATEVDGTSEAAAHAVRWLPWVIPTTLGMAFVFTRRTMKTNNFLFWRPSPKFDASIFPSKRAPIFRGPQAVFAWHSIRLLCYIPPLWFVHVLLYSSLAETTYQAHLPRDPRLNNLLQDIVKRARAQVLQNQRSPRNLPGRPGAGTPQSTQGANPIPPSSRDQYPSEPGNQTAQDYAPEPYPDQPENSFGGPPVGSNNGTASPAPQPSWSRNTQPQAQSNQHQDYDSDLFDDDDASPVSAASKRAEAEKSRNAQGGSAWDRLRQQAQSGSTRWTQGDSSGQERGWGQLRQDKTQTPKDRQPKTESFAYTEEQEYKERRNYEKEQAQKEFDALLEAERRGESNKR
ncbi:hypothetical protein F4819DRAFT_185408 [Hypoxylon fuscum]|nr:hypothetical protein F4819DRAFT_185408 [Hypoxylon fuscum]